jgi:protease-4
MAARRDVIIGTIIAGSFLMFVAVMLLAFWGVSSGDEQVFGGFGDRIAVVEVAGQISSSRSVVAQLRRWSEADNVPVILLRVDSPGGGVAASQEIHEEILRARAKGKKVVASMGTVAASGGLYVAVACDTIVANPGTLTGSIGVIFQYPTFEGLLDKVGIRYETVKSGPYKDVGNLGRTMTPSDSAHLQSIIDDTYDQFVEAVADGRGMTKDEVKVFADGRIFTGRQAKELHIIDELGDYHDALDIAAEMAGLAKPPKTVKEEPRKRTGLVDFLGRSFVEWMMGQSPDWEYSEPSLQYRYH